MDTLTLSDILLAQGVNPNDYSIGALRDNSLVIISEDRQWKVFFYEKGQRLNEHAFSRMEDACAYFLQVVESWKDKYGSH
jgi:hypothetical protein